MSTNRIAIAIVPAFFIFATCAKAAPVVILDSPSTVDTYDDDLDDDDTIVVPESDDVIVDNAPIEERLQERPMGTRVFGWSERNGCGTYYYWNGETCVDARTK